MTDITLTTNLDPIWNKQNTGASGSNLKPCYGGGVWLIPVDQGSGDTSKIWRSMDGVNWAQVNLPFAVDTVKCLWLQNSSIPNGTFVLIEGNNSVSSIFLTSPNGLFWTAHNFPVPSYWYCSDIVSTDQGNVLFIVERNAQSQWRSADLVNFFHTADSYSQNQQIGVRRGMLGPFGQYYGFSNTSAAVGISFDLMAWTSHVSTIEFAIEPLYSPVAKIFVAPGASAFWSEDGINWTKSLDDQGAFVDGTYNMEYDATAGQFVCMSNPKNKIYTSADGKNFKPSTKPWTGPLPNYLAAAQTRPQQFVSTATVGGNQANYGNPSMISGKLYVPHNFTRLIGVSK